MDYWLDIRLKIRRFFRRNKKKIIIILIVWLIIIIINFYFKYRTVNVVPQTTYEPHSPVIDTTDKVPEKYKKPISNLIYNFFEYCNNKDYESAYNLLSSEFKDRYCKDIEQFKEYVDITFNTKKIYNIQNYSNLNNTYVYRVRFLEDILASGTTDDYSYREDKFVIKEENGVLKISLNGFCGSEEKDIDVEDSNMEIKILKKYMLYDEASYEVQIKNKTDNFILLTDSTTDNEIQLEFPNETRYANYIENSNIVILPNTTKTFEFTFDEYFDDRKDPTKLTLNAIRILPEYTGWEEKAEEENEAAIKRYSLAIDLIPTQR